MTFRNSFLSFFLKKSLHFYSIGSGLNTVLQAVKMPFKRPKLSWTKRNITSWTNDSTEIEESGNIRSSPGSLCLKSYESHCISHSKCSQRKCTLVFQKQSLQHWTPADKMRRRVVKCVTCAIQKALKCMHGVSERHGRSELLTSCVMIYKWWLIIHNVWWQWV